MTASRRCAVRTLMAFCVLAALAIVGAAVHRLGEAEAAAQARRAEVERIRQALIRSAEAAERATIATTPPEVRQARKDAAMREFQAAEAEMLMRQTLARRAREAGAASAGSGSNAGRAAAASGP